MKIGETVVKAWNWYLGPGKTFLNEVPFAAALIRDGVRTSEGALASGLVAIMAREAFKASPSPWILAAEALGLVGVGIYAYARGGVKAAVVTASSNEEEETDPVKGFLTGSN